MRKTIVVLIAVLCTAGLAVIGTGHPASAEPGNCVQNGTKHAYLCYYHAPGTGGGVYATLVLFENWYYWHPKTGDQVVDETYAKASAPGYSPVTGHRRIGFADGRSVNDSTWLAKFPANTGPPTDCAGPDGGVSACTPSEQQSAMDFQFAMTHDGIHHSF